MTIDTRIRDSWAIYWDQITASDVQTRSVRDHTICQDAFLAGAQAALTVMITGTREAAAHVVRQRRALT